MFLSVRIRQHERGLLYRGGDFVRLLAPGRHWMLGWLLGRRTSIEAVSTLTPRFENVLLDVLLEQFGGDHAVAYNVIAGHILKSAPRSDKSIDMDAIGNPLNSRGLYLSYTLAKMRSAGVHVSDDKIDADVAAELQFAHLRARANLAPNILFQATVDHAKRISSLYETHRIAGSADNARMFADLASDLLWGMKKMGLMDVQRV